MVGNWNANRDESQPAIRILRQLMRWQVRSSYAAGRVRRELVQAGVLINHFDKMVATIIHPMTRFTAAPIANAGGIPTQLRF